MIDKLRELWVNYRYQLLVGGMLVLGVIVFAGQRVLNAPAASDQSFSSSVTVESGSQSSSEVSGQPTRVCVDVKGAVRHPGIYYFKRGSRIAEALKAAGGSLPNAEMKAVNLAKELADQQVVYVPVVGEQVPAEGGGVSMANDNQDVEGHSPINLNTATKEQLCQINGIGDKKADLIIEYRQQHGQFKTVDELTQVTGFGEKTVAKLKDQVSV